MALVIKGSSSGQITVDVPAAAGTNTVTIPAVTGNLPTSNLNHVTNRPNTKPLVINGDMQVSQRGTSTTGITSVSVIYTTDRWRFDVNALGTWTVQQLQEAVPGARTVPQIFLNDEYVGGYKELETKLQEQNG